MQGKRMRVAMLSFFGC